ncbi:phosphoribosylformylglycinamidine cyclo-ligase [Apibacter muscae]|uniref:Phosphoribosylformylglycinamidine cyclo-ligase n=1 Tax=Apibacter muscae TaxID=2509004 RepID=A0A563D8R6_9FLAO|nr:phosphoribosylformylglycinamidine cyclo-ligase [Apibacter muscae]TWP26636.1 phosphoribosylformylglycinamidine cyclo-ligase [Apibacter muscae]TWP28210.1 phosphoribosylformylglycinamidine cyclo-ligase [Apibacter muscae]
MMTTYKDSGVDKEEGYQTVSKIKDEVSQTHNPNVLNNIGSFGAFYELSGYKNPILVSGTDGVGTKLRIALDSEIYDTIGIDCFAMCANDILCHGAKPLFFLDYLACGNLDSDIASKIILGIVKACKETKTALIGGETAEMPGMYKKGDYDVAGFCVGVVEKEDIIDGTQIKKDQVIISLPSSGFHSNGYSLIRKIFTDINENFEGQPLYKTLLTPTRLYQNDIFKILEKYPVYGIAHITGGGIIENLPRIIPNGLCANISVSSIHVPSIMKELQKRGKISNDEMFGTFNMGVGMCIIVDEENSLPILNLIEGSSIIGNIINNSKKIILNF